jgi:hypothetical protein
MKNKLILVFSLMAAGCETMGPMKSQAQIEIERINGQIRQAVADGDKCNDDIRRSPLVSRFTSEILYDEINPSSRLELITNKSQLTDEQLQLVKSAYPSIIRCRPIWERGLSGTPFFGIYQKYNIAIDSIFVELSKREISIGEANEKKVKAVEARIANIARAESEWNNSLQLMHNSEIDQRRQATAAMLPFLMQQQQNFQMQQQLLYQQQIQNIYNNKPPLTSPTTTNCYTLGAHINCVTN